MTMKNIIMAIAALSAVSCAALDDAEYKTLHELASPERTIVVPADGGEAVFTVYSNGNTLIEAIGLEASQATVSATSLEGDGKIHVTFPENSGMRRMVTLCLSLDEGKKLDTLYAKQEGVKAFMDCTSPFRFVDGRESRMTGFELQTNIPFEDLDTEISYLSGPDGWIESVSSDLGTVIVKTRLAGADSGRGEVALSFIDGWGESLKTSLFITISDNTGAFGEKVPFSEIGSYAGKGKIGEDLFIEGVVVSDCNSRNMELNPSVSYDKVDIEENGRTAYVTSEDRMSGVRLKFSEAGDNVLVHGVGIKFSLRDAEIHKDDGTESYTVTGLTGASVISTTEPSAVLPKVKRLGELTDSDLYTYVSIPDMEFACKFGSYANVYENYVLKSEVNQSAEKNNNRLDGWATLLVDGEGRAVYAPVNMLCLWRRSGKGVPQGRGPLTGILVSNDMKRYGNLGRYQVRVLDESGFGQEWSGSGAFTTLAEWDGAPYQYRFSQYKSNPRYQYNALETIIPSDDFSSSNKTPAAELVCENHSVGNNTSWPLSSYSTYTYVKADGLGAWPSAPVGDFRKSLCISADIKGWYDWDGNTITGYNGICVSFSTKELQGSMIQFHYAFCVGNISAATSRYFPAHWCSEYSIDGGVSWRPLKDAATGADYVHMRSLPWWDASIGGVTYRTNSHCGLGPTEHVSYLPSDAFGHDKVIVRVRPYDNVMAVFPTEWNDDVETAYVLHNTTVKETTVQFDYIYISYR